MLLSMMDFLSAIFFIVAGIWLFAAILYSLMVFYFLRLRSQNLLHTIHDDEFGRFYIFPKCGCYRLSNAPSNDDTTITTPTNNEQAIRRYYISFGWIFRRYARHLNIDAGIERDAPRYKRSERREAVQVLLQQRQIQHQRKKLRNSKSTHCPPVTKSSSLSSTSLSDEDVPRNIFQRLYASRQSPSSNLKAIGASHSCSDAAVLPYSVKDQSNEDKNDLSHMENGVANTTEISDIHHHCNNALSCSMEEVPICSICLGPYENDDSDDADDQLGSTKNLDATLPSTRTAAVGSAHTVFQSSTCVHQFHMECILNWLQRKTNVECPCCRIPMIDDKEVWKTIVNLRKQKLRSIQKLKQQLQQQRSKLEASRNNNHQQDDDPIDATTNSETEHEVQL